jgi:hypothetical protein
LTHRVHGVIGKEIGALLITLALTKKYLYCLRVGAAVEISLTSCHLFIIFPLSKL